MDDADGSYADHVGEGGACSGVLASLGFAAELGGDLGYMAYAGGALAGALQLAEDVLAAGPLAVRASKQIVQHAYDWAESDAWTLQSQFTAPVMNSEDLQEGLRAFADKRPAIWKGR